MRFAEGQLFVPGRANLRGEQNRESGSEGKDLKSGGFMGALLGQKALVVWGGGLACGIFGTLWFIGAPVRNAFERGETGQSRIPDDFSGGTVWSEEAAEGFELLPAGIRRILMTDPVAARGEERGEVLRFLSGKLSGVPALSEIPFAAGDFRWVADRTMTWLRQAFGDSDLLAHTFLQIAREERNVEELRECAIAHLGRIRVSDSVGVEVGRGVVALAAEDPSAIWVGAALGLLGREFYAMEHPEWVRERCLEVAADPRAHVVCRTVAFDLAARKGWHEAEPLARIQSVSAVSMAERIAALRAVAELGNEDTLRWITKWEPPQDPVLAACWTMARDRLSERGPKY